MENVTLPQIVLEIEKQHKAGNATAASQSFQLLYAQVRTHAHKLYVSVLYGAFKTNDVSARAEEVFLNIIGELERYIRKGKFPEYETDKEVIREFIRLVRQRTYWRTKSAMKKWRETPLLRAADLPENFLSRLPDTLEDSAEEDAFHKEGILFVFGKLSVKDADLLRTRYYGTLTQQEADAILMARYNYSKEGSLHKAIWWAEQRFKKHWKEFLRLHHNQTTNTNLKSIQDETPS